MFQSQTCLGHLEGFPSSHVVSSSQGCWGVFSGLWPPSNVYRTNWWPHTPLSCAANHFNTTTSLRVLMKICPELLGLEQLGAAEYLLKCCFLYPTHAPQKGCKRLVLRGGKRLLHTGSRAHRGQPPSSSSLPRVCSEASFPKHCVWMCM